MNQGLKQARPTATLRIADHWSDQQRQWTIGDAAQRWLAARHGWSPLTITRYTKSIERFMADMGGPDVPLERITPMDWTEWVTDLRPLRTRAGKREYQDSGRNATVQPVRAFFSWAINLRLIPADPTMESPPAKVRQAPPPRLTREAVRRLIDTSSGGNRVRIVLFATYGIRLAEMRRLRVEDWDRERDLLTVLGKGNKVRVLPLFGEPLEFLRMWVRLELRGAGGPLWPSPRDGTQSLSSQWIGREVATAGEAIGVPVHPHLLRHHAISEMVEEGMDLETVRYISGHATLATLSIYTHAAPEHVRQTLERYRRPYG